MGHCWFKFVSNDQLLREKGMRNTPGIVRDRGLHLVGHVARFNSADPVYQVFSLKDAAEQGRRRGRPQSAGRNRWTLSAGSVTQGWGLPGGLPRGDLWSIAIRWMRLRAALEHDVT